MLSSKYKVRGIFDIEIYCSLGKLYWVKARVRLGSRLKSGLGSRVKSGLGPLMEYGLWLRLNLVCI